MSELPKSTTALLDAMWRRIMSQMSTTVNQQIVGYFGQSFRGGKLDASSIAGTIPGGNIPFGAATGPIAIGQAENDGSATSAARSDHIHAFPTPTNVAVTGLTGATAASRYVGATASGAPVTGAFQLGDYVIDQTGKVWICTAAGTPGSWAQTSGSSQIYAPLTDPGNGAPSLLWTTAGDVIVAPD